MVFKVAVSGACLGLACACLLTARTASAWEALQLTLQGTAFVYQKESVTPDGASSSTSSSATSFGFVNNGLGAGIGYAWDHVLFGARAQFLSTSSNGNDSTLVQLMPRLEYLFEPGATSPYLAAILGVEHSSASPSGGATSVSSTGFDYGAAFGVHAFLDPAVSIDPELALLGASGSTTASGDGFADQKASESDIRVMITLGLSGWLGARHVEPAACVPPQYAAPAPPPPPVKAPESDADEVKPLFTNIHLPGHRRLYVQVSQDPAHTALIIRLSEARTEAALATCDDISVADSAGTLKMRVRSHGEHFVAGLIAPHAIELLANTEAQISVCGAQWTLGAESREDLQSFLKDRRDLQNQGEDSDEPAPPPAAVTQPAALAPSSAPAAPRTPATPPAPAPKTK